LVKSIVETTPPVTEKPVEKETSLIETKEVLEEVVSNSTKANGSLPLSNA